MTIILAALFTSLFGFGVGYVWGFDNGAAATLLKWHEAVERAEAARKEER